MRSEDGGPSGVVDDLLRPRVALLLCGEFNPPNYAHLRIFERARDYLERVRGWQVVEGALSLSRDRAGLAAVKHRLRMMQTALADSSWLRVSSWESAQKTEAGIVAVLREYQAAVCTHWGHDVRVIFLCGSDYFAYFGRHSTDEKTFSASSVKEIVSEYGVIVLVRRHTNPAETIYESDLLRQHQANIHLLHDETFPNDLSSMRLRVALRRHESIRYCTPDRVIEYIAKHRLYAPIVEHLPDCVYYKSKSRSDDSTEEEVIQRPEKAASQRPKSPPPFPQPPPRSSSAQPSSMANDPAIKPTVGHATKQRLPPLNPHWKEVEEKRMEKAPEPDVSLATTATTTQDDPLPTPPPSIASRVKKEKEEKEREKSASIVRPLPSPNYDNVTLEELLAASTCWAEYMSEQCRKLKETPSFVDEELLLSTSAGKAATDKRGFWPRKEGRVEVDPHPKKSSMNGEKADYKEGKSVRVEAPQSAREQRERPKLPNQSVRSADDMALMDKSKKMTVTMSKSLYDAGDENGDDDGTPVYLTFRQYRLTATPETTV